MDHRRFRAAYDFLLLREAAGEDTGGLGEFWTEIQALPFEERLKLTGAGRGRKRKPRTRRSGQGQA